MELWNVQVEGCYHELGQYQALLGDLGVLKDVLFANVLV